VGEGRVASLGMYDPPWLRGANDALWRGIAARLRDAGVADVPDALDRGRPLGAIWRDPRLLLAQTCGYPLATSLREAVTVVAAPVHDLPGCGGARHRSLVVVAQTSSVATLAELRGARAAINGRDSNTGMNLLRRAVAPLARRGRFFGAVRETGSHLASMEAVRTGAADVAAIDCVTFALARRHRPALVEGLRVLAESDPSPSLPFVTRGGADVNEVAALRSALAGALADPALATTADALALARVEPVSAEDYEILLRYERAAAAAGYPGLA
jgi:ABC-type phosphate/phosphonate transport system substrate-binding protein